MSLPIKPGDIITNDELMSIFACAPRGGMRKSKTTNSLILISDKVGDNPYVDTGLRYTGMGKSGDQDINYRQNRTLATSRNTSIEIHFFEVNDACLYEYIGQVELADDPYRETQKGEDGIDRKVWIFPLRIKKEQNDSI